MGNGNRWIKNPLEWPTWLWLVLVLFLGGPNVLTLANTLSRGTLLGRSAATEQTAAAASDLDRRLRETELNVARVATTVDQLADAVGRLAEATARINEEQARTAERLEALRKELDRLQRDAP